VKHAGPSALDRLEPMLAEIRALPQLIEKSRGAFWSRPRVTDRISRSFLHFHEDPAGLHADVRAPSGDFDRFRVEDDAERTAFLSEVHRRLSAATQRSAATR
jgi:hypothetical protein